MIEANKKPKNRFKGKDKAIASLVCGVISLLLINASVSAGFAVATVALISTSTTEDDPKGNLGPVRDRDGNVVGGVYNQQEWVQGIILTVLGSTAFAYVAVFSTPFVAIAGIVLAKKSLNSGGRGKIRTLGLTLSVLGVVFGFTLLLPTLFWMGQNHSRNLILADELSRLIFSRMG